MSEATPLRPVRLRSRKKIAYTDQPQAARMPIDTSVSIEDDRCLACLSAAWWNGHAAQVATGAASATRTHCQPGKRDHGKIDNTMDRSVSGTKNTRARISRRRRRLTVAPSAANEVSAASGRASSAE